MTFLVTPSVSEEKRGLGEHTASQSAQEVAGPIYMLRCPAPASRFWLYYYTVLHNAFRYPPLRIPGFFSFSVGPSQLGMQPRGVICEPSLAGRNLAMPFTGPRCLRRNPRRESDSGPGVPVQGGLQGTALGDV